MTKFNNHNYLPVAAQNFVSNIRYVGFANDKVMAEFREIENAVDEKSCQKHIALGITYYAEFLECDEIRVATYIAKHSSGAPITVEGKVVNVEIVNGDDDFDEGDYVGYITVCQENGEEVTFFEDNEAKVQEAIVKLKEKAIVTYVFGEN